MNKKKMLQGIVPACAGILLLATLPALAQQAERLTLRRAVALATQNSRELALARINHNVAERSAGVAGSVFLPNLYTGSGLAYTNGFPLGAPTTFNLSYVQTVFNPPLRGEFRASQERAEVRRLGVERTRDAVILRTVSSYLELVKVRHSLELMRKERASAQKILDVTRARAGEGLELPIEVTRAQLTAARIEQRIVQLEGREDVLETDLRSLLGMAYDQRVEVEREDVPLEGIQPTSQLIQLAMDNNLEIRQAEHERRAREHSLKGEKGGYLPTLDVVGQYGLFSRFNNYDEFYNRFERHNVTIGVQARIPIFSSRTSSAVSLARTQLTAAELELKNKRADVEVQVRKQVRGIREAETGREVGRLELQLAQDNLRVVQARFEEGRASLRDLEQARLEEHNKWMAFLDADFALQQSQLEILRTTGQLARVFQ
jgi:outer membrane protein TolC